MDMYEHIVYLFLILIGLCLALGCRRRQVKTTNGTCGEKVSHAQNHKQHSNSKEETKASRKERKDSSGISSDDEANLLEKKSDDGSSDTSDGTTTRNRGRRYGSRKGKKQRTWREKSATGEVTNRLEEEEEEEKDLHYYVVATTSSSSSSGGEDSPKKPSANCRGKSGKNARRHRRNHRKDSQETTENIPSEKGKEKSVTFSGGCDEERIWTLTPPLRQHTKLNMSEDILSSCLRSYILLPHQLRPLGFPVTCDWDRRKVIIYKSSPGEFFTLKRSSIASSGSGFDVNAAEFIPASHGVIVNECDGLEKPSEPLLSEDSGQSSGSSSPPSVDGEETFDDNRTFIPSEEKRCCRCGRGFFVTVDGEYLTHEQCVFHWGKLQRVDSLPFGRLEFSCCGNDAGSPGCTRNRLHVWYGLQTGLNGPFEGFVATRPGASDGKHQIFGLDCEMCFTGRGLELCKVSVVASDGRLLYERLVRPECEIVDYNTRFSGISEQDFTAKSQNIRTLKEVQQDLLKMIGSEAILVGHGLENDLRALKIIHRNIIDTSVVFPHTSGLPFRRSLKSLAKTFLKRDIQTGTTGHDSLEDSRACIELMLWRVRKDFRSTIH
ncbi:Ribonuclease H superfamily [Sergentomyia squamirostris]